jgi:predicted DNA-binding transcriptional regulator AlpA
MDKLEAPGVVPGTHTTATFVGKKEIAALCGMSVRWVEAQCRAGMPHMAFGRRRTKFIPSEVTEWLKLRFGVQRRGGVRA